MAEYTGTPGDDYMSLDDYYTLDYNHDTMDGGAGNDSMYGSFGNDTMNGGAGDDTMNGWIDYNKVGGVDAILDWPDNDSMDGGAGNDSMDGDRDNDSMDGGAGNDSMDGGTGNDTMNGGAGNDTMNGGADNDRLYGQSGNDSLNGGNDYDLLYGGSGSDTLTGGEGRDTFTWDMSSLNDGVPDRDVITDYEVKVGNDIRDAIDLPNAENSVVEVVDSSGGVWGTDSEHGAFSEVILKLEGTDGDLLVVQSHDQGAIGDTLEIIDAVAVSNNDFSDFAFI